MSDILNDLSELVYITDIDNYDLLYINSSGKEMFKLETIKGLKCHKVLHGLDKPCPFCILDKLDKDHIYTWDHLNTVVNKHFLLKDRLIEWEGKLSHLEIAIDITKQKDEQDKLEESLSNQMFLMHCVEELYKCNNLNDAISTLIEPVHTFLKADATMFVNMQDQTLNRYKVVDNKNDCYDFLSDLNKENSTGWLELLKDKEILVIDNLQDEAYQNIEICQKALLKGIHSIVIAVLSETKEVNSYIVAMNAEAQGFSKIVPIIKTLHYFLMLSTKRWNALEQLEEISYMDVLTSLNNRNSFMYDTKCLADKQESVGVVYLDMNGLKDINDKEGHKKGDAALQECASILKKVFTFPNANIYRMGGDEFAVIWVGVQEKAFMDEVNELRKEFTLFASFKIAIGFVWAPSTKHIDDLVSEADFRMYEDKKRFYRNRIGSNRYRHYNDEILELVQPDVLTQKLNKGSFIVYAQPKFSFKDKSLIGAEALVRYLMPSGEVLAPGHFLPLLEDRNLIGNIDFYVFEKICAKQEEWKKKGYRIVPISTNFSRYSIMDRGFIAHLNEIVEKYGVDREMLEIEITETVEGLEWFDIIERIEEIRKAGYVISVDDFGARYANLSLFTSIEFSVLKIDKSLVDNIVSNEKAQSVVSAIVDICRSMNVRVIVEGVETHAQYETLKRMGCEGIQGFLFSKPLPLHEFEISFLEQ